MLLAWAFADYFEFMRAFFIFQISRSDTERTVLLRAVWPAGENIDTDFALKWFAAKTQKTKR